MKRFSVIIALILALTLSTTAFAVTYDTIESTHGTHANPGLTVYTYSVDGKTITEEKPEVINVCPMSKFTDLKAANWSHEGIDYVLSHGYMVGTTDTKFEPDGSMTRAMIVTVLYRVAGDTGVATSKAGSVPFTDVQNGRWYTDAIKWAYANGIVKGMNEKTFAPDVSVSREQITLFICRFAKFIGDDVTAKGDISKFKDVSTLSAESRSAVSWAVGKGILKGFGNGKIGPKDTATRAQFAVMLQRWMDGRCENHKYVLHDEAEVKCTADGGKLYVCSICGAEKYERVPATGHSYGDKTVSKAPTCTEDGTYEQVCKNCGDKITETAPATGHSYGDKTVTQKPTCTKEGVSEQVCKNCGHKITEAIPATDHSYGLMEVSKAPTCTEDGSYEQICADCGDKITGTIPATGHKYGEKEIGKATGCTEEGTYVKVCSNCGDTVVLETIPATGHNYSEKIVKEATCTAEGEKQKICSVCGDTMSDSIPKLPHEYVDGVCTVCGGFEHPAVKTASLSDGDRIIIVNPADSLSLGMTEKEITINSVKANVKGNEIGVEEGMAVLNVEKASDGFYLVTDSGKYLSCIDAEDGCRLCFADNKSDNALWTLSDGYIKNVNVKIDGKAQYIACRKSCFAILDMSSNTQMYTMEFYKLQ